MDWSTVQEADRVAFAKAFRRLLELQTTCVILYLTICCSVSEMTFRSGQRVHADAEGGAPDAAVGLYALQALVQPVAMRFKYHFEGTRATNKLDKVRFLSFSSQSNVDWGMLTNEGTPDLARMVLHSHPKRRT